MKENDIAIVGMSCCFPGADNIREFWSNLSNGVDSITDIPEEIIDPRYFSQDGTSAVDQFYFHKGGFIKPISIDPLHYGVLPIAAKGIDPEHLIALRLVEDALTDAQVYKKKIPLNNCSFILGKGNYIGQTMFRLGDIVHTGAVIENMLHYLFPDLSAEEVKKIKKDYQAKCGRFQADTAAGAMPNLIVSLAANKFDLKGPAYTIDAACASSLLAVEHSINLLLSGQCDIALAGGMHLGQGASFWGVFNTIGAASHRQQIAPFSENADGLLIGEGAGIVVLKKMEKAIADNDRIYAVIKGYGSSSDGSDVSVMAPSSKGQQMALKLAWERAGISPEKVGYVETHGTATQIGDRTEMATLIDFFGDNSMAPALLGSVKSNIGHAMPAAGIAGLIKTVLALYHKKIPPTLHCENPMKAMSKSRFQPAQSLIDWDGGKYPLIAGVNAFGFGGINTHVVVEACHNAETVNSAPARKQNLLKDKVIVLSASTKEELLKKLDNGDYSISNGDYRLVIFNPSEERIKKAKALIEKDKPWKGRLDIWFSNKPLLKENGKVAFLFAGFDPGTEIEIQSVADYYDIPYNQVDIGADQLAGHSINHFYRSKLLDSALKKMGLTPDMNAGHSIGEWYALAAGNYFSSDSMEKLIATYNPEEYTIVDIFYIAIGCGYERIKSWCETIPELYLANDNCPNQILMAGRKEARDMLTERLNKEQIYYQILPFQSGHHTPLVPEESMTGAGVMMNTLVKREHQIPVWSSTILNVYPESQDEIYALCLRHLVETVRFRELIEKLYEQEQVKMFVQIGFGSLLSFVEDTLKDKAISTISTVNRSLSGIEHFRRIAALFFIEGKTINKELIGISEERTSMKGKEITLDMKYTLVRDFSLLKDAMDKYIQKVNTASSMFPSFSGEELSDPILRQVSDNLCEIASLQENVLKWYNAKAPTKQTQNITKIARDEKDNLSRMEISRPKAGSTIEKPFRLTLEDHPYLLDHVVVRQPENWPNMKDLNPVVPFAMTLELLCENAQELMPGKKVMKITSAGVFKWIPVTEPFVAKLQGVWTSEDCISWTLPNHASGSITLGDAFSPVPEEYEKEIDLGDENIVSLLPDKEKLYSHYLFHGPRYQSVIEIIKVTKNGLRARIRKTEGKGSMLDNLGQLLGTYCGLALDKDQGTFPMSVEEIQFYQDIQDQKGEFDYTLVIREMNDSEAISNVVIKRDGKVWCVVKGWHNRRFGYGKTLMDTILCPKEFIIAKHLEDSVYYYYNTGGRASSLDFIYERYLNSKEKEVYHSLYLNKARDYLIRCIAVKDAVRKSLQKNDSDPLLYPIEISIEYDANGKPCLCGHEKLKGVEVSIAHKGSEAVAFVSKKPAGIDIEKIEDREQGFLDIAFTEQEMALLKTLEGNRAEWIARFWVAKEAYGKMLGLGLQGNPKQYEVATVNGEILEIKGTFIKTVKHRDDYIVGWTQI